MNANPKFLNTAAQVDAGAVKPLPNSRKVYIPGSVSYTHLTLPTKRIV